MLFDLAPEAIVVFDADTGCIVDANVNAERLSGRSRDYLLNSPPSLLFEAMAPGGAVFAENQTKYIRQALNGQDVIFERMFRLAEGEDISCEVRLVRLPVDNRRLVRASIVDISTRKRVEESLRHNEERFRYMLETSPIAVRIATAAGNRLLFANRRYTQLIGVNIQQEQVTQINPRSYYAEPQTYDEIMRNLLRGEAVSDKLVELLVGSGKHVWTMASYLNLVYEDEPAILAWFYDVTELRNVNEELRLASMVYQNSSEAMAVTDVAHRVIAINPAFTQTTGYAAEEALGQILFRLLDVGRHDPAYYAAIKQSIGSTGRWQGEMWHRRKDGETFASSIAINTIFNEDGTPHRHVALFADVTHRKQTDELIWRQANFDPLTNLPNRSMFQECVALEIKKAQRSELQVALLFIDLDHFKEVNDTLGHHIGDRLLVDAAQRIRACVRESDVVARLGGDEFTVLVPGIGYDDTTIVERVARMILDSLSKPFRLGEEEAYISASIGITLYPGDSQVIEDLYRNADQAMYVAKSQGRNRYSYFTPALQAAAQSRLRLINDMRVALSDGQFRLHFQPVVDLGSGQITKVEALIRWQHPQRGMVSPLEFIPLAEETGMILEIGDWVFRESVRWVKRWRERYHVNFQVSVNKSPVQFYKNAQGHAAWLAHLQALGLPGQCLVIEITEGLLLHAEPAIAEALLRYRDAGVQIAIDDFGTGYSSLAYLKKFDIDYLKIDQSFTRNLAPGSNDLALSEAIIVMAHKLGLKVIAEGVETLAQRELLAAVDCDCLQGYLFSKPVPPEELEILLERECKVPSIGL